MTATMISAINQSNSELHITWRQQLLLHLQLFIQLKGIQYYIHVYIPARALTGQYTYNKFAHFSYEFLKNYPELISY